MHTYFIIRGFIIQLLELSALMKMSTKNLTGKTFPRI